MIKVSIEIIPNGRIPETRDVAQVRIINETADTSKPISRYRVEYEIPNPDGSAAETRVRHINGWDRIQRSIWELIAEALLSFQ